MTTAMKLEMKLEVGIHVPKCQMTRVQMIGEGLFSIIRWVGNLTQSKKLQAKPHPVSQHCGSKGSQISLSWRPAWST